MREKIYSVFYCPSCGYILEGSHAEYNPEWKKVCRYCGAPMKLAREYEQRRDDFTSKIYYQGELMRFDVTAIYELNQECIDYNRKMAHDLIRERLVYPNPEYSREKERQRIEADENWRPPLNGANGPKCPTCGSTNIRSIGGLERGTSVALFGLFSRKINKSFKCNNCGYTW